jgi:hypothetical protein
MSVPVALERLHDEIGRFGHVAYLLTVGADGRAHAVSSPVGWDGDRLTAEGGSRTRANAAERPLVSLLWPPYEPGGYSLIVDGRAVVDGDRVVVRPSKGVLHRSAPAGDEPQSACGSDCVPLT